MSGRTLKFTYTDAGGLQEIKITPRQYTTFSLKWDKDAVQFKNPFTGRKTEKKRGHYFNASIGFVGISYSEMYGVGAIFDTAITDLIFFPDASSTESFPVTVQGTEYLDFLFMYAENLTIVIESIDRYDSPINPPDDCWGSRTMDYTRDINYNGV